MSLKIGDKALTYNGVEVIVLDMGSDYYTYEVIDKSILVNKDDDGIFTGNYLKQINHERRKKD